MTNSMVLRAKSKWLRAKEQNDDVSSLLLASSALFLFRLAQRHHNAGLPVLCGPTCGADAVDISNFRISATIQKITHNIVMPIRRRPHQCRAAEFVLQIRIRSRIEQ